MASSLSFLVVWLLQISELQGDGWGYGERDAGMEHWEFQSRVQGAAGTEAACGQPVFSPRIVGGQDAVEGSWPWQASILQNGHHVCGGSLINQQWVVSAAHCFTSSGMLYEVQLGAYKLSDPSPNTVTLSVERIISHPDYKNYEGSSGDIALVELNSPVPFTDYILPICLPVSFVEFAAGISCWVTGWGNTMTSEKLAYPQTLQEVEVPIIDRDTCNDLYNISSGNTVQTNPVEPDMICAGYKQGGKDACQGDSGGPLVCTYEGAWTLAGVVSWGSGCAERNHPGVYTLVPYYADWIEEMMNGNDCGLPKFSTVTLLLITLVLTLL